jgi:hypothetical protein
MLVELHNKLGQPQRIEATRIVVSDPEVGVVAVIVEAAPHHIYAVHRGDGDEVVNRALQQLGIDRTVISNEVDLDKFPRPKGNLILQPGAGA